MTRSDLVTAIATIAVVVAIVVFHPADQFATVRRAIGLGQERGLPARRRTQWWVVQLLA